MRLIDADALTEKCGDWYIEEGTEEGFIGTLEQLLSEQPETNCSEIPNNWIPCSERLPDTNRDVLLQFSTNMGVGFWEHNSWGVNTGDNIYSEIGEGEAQPIAWCELPEQYQEGGDDHG